MHTGQPIAAYSAAAAAMRTTALRRFRRSTVSTIGSTPGPARNLYAPDNAWTIPGLARRPQDEIQVLRNRDCKVTNARSTAARSVASADGSRGPDLSQVVKVPHLFFINPDHANSKDLEWTLAWGA